MIKQIKKDKTTMYWIYDYYWLNKQTNEKIEMLGRFTEESWQLFCRNPHPINKQIEIYKINRFPSANQQTILA